MRKLLATAGAFRERPVAGPFVAWVGLLAVACSGFVAGQDTAAQPRTKKPSPWLPEDLAPQCLFLPQTAIPMLAMAVRTMDDDPELRDLRRLELWERPEAPTTGAEPLKRVPLFRPYFVYDVRTVDGIPWHLLGSKYAGAPLGWADGRQLRRLESRYAYHFNNPKRVPPGVHLYGSREGAYKALEAQGLRRPQAPLDDVVVAERIQEEYWDPRAPDAIPPFIELADEDIKDPFAAGLTDTTLTFPFPGENRLIRLGAVAGGPVDRDAIARMGGAAQERAGIAIMFLIDETLSMQKFFGGVADFIDTDLDLGDNAVNVRVAVCWYSDIEKPGDVPYVVQPLQPLNGPEIAAADAQAAKGRLVAKVRDHRERIIGGMGAQSEELIYEGLIAAIKAGGFNPGENAMVFVIGDAPDRTEPDKLRGLQREVERLITENSLQLAFIQVSDDAVAQAFTTQAEQFRDGLPPALRDSVIVQKARGELGKRIADLQDQMNRKRRALLAEIEEMETRNSYAQPGPVLEQEFVAKGIDRKAFDQSHLQFFVPAWGWLYHPQQAEATPQLRELVFLAKPESDALLPTLNKAADGLEREGRIDIDAVRKLLAEVLGERSGHEGVAAALEAAWQALPPEDRTLGRFFEQGLGLRVRNPLLFHRGAANPAAPPTRQSVQLLRTSRERIANDRNANRTWSDAWKVLP